MFVLRETVCFNDLLGSQDAILKYTHVTWFNQGPLLIALTRRKGQKGKTWLQDIEQK